VLISVLLKGSGIGIRHSAKKFAEPLEGFGGIQDRFELKTPPGK
jgi:hypothetical protein